MTNLEKQAKEFIHETFWGYANGIIDCGTEDYPLMTKDEYKDYIWKTLDYEKNIVVNGVERKHIYFIGKTKFMTMVDEFLQEEDCQEYIVLNDEKVATRMLTSLGVL